MSEWLDSLPPPPSLLPGGWWTIAGLGVVAVLILGFALLRRLSRPAVPERSAESQRGEPLRGELVTDRRTAFNTTGTPEGRDPSPPGLPPGQEARLQRVRAVADFLDNSLKIPGLGYPIGWDSVIGLAPGVGDVATGTLAAWIILQGRQLGVPKRTLVRMCGNAGIDIASGAVPGVGDVFDVVFKANRKNLRLIEIHLAKPPKGQKTLPS
ncbi:DUF4112 domain-containing protein [Alienimonas chondri]|uniref:DUF4112 domain-containing protein n=1 Tax=Alienimonas chondri TaxID=2681879 RepID=A0ABX1VKA5_9PLAN|nr:DUF4112 domain-containing protein [Alienimonas chondri]NNJ27638.1 hypothetical protein [Alienimonas chondri]